MSELLLKYERSLKNFVENALKADDEKTLREFKIHFLNFLENPFSEKNILNIYKYMYLENLYNKIDKVDSNKEGYIINLNSIDIADANDINIFKSDMERSIDMAVYNTYSDRVLKLVSDKPFNNIIMTKLKSLDKSLVYFNFINGRLLFLIKTLKDEDLFYSLVDMLGIKVRKIDSNSEANIYISDALKKESYQDSYDCKYISNLEKISYVKQFLENIV